MKNVYLVLLHSVPVSNFDNVQVRFRLSHEFHYNKAAASLQKTLAAS